MDDCIFCKIASGAIPCDKVYEDDRLLAFRDIAPQAPTHILVIPKAHCDNLLACAENKALLTDVFEAVAAIAQSEGLAANGFRVVTNCGRDGAQSVAHFHVHLLGGRPLTGQMG